MLEVGKNRLSIQVYKRCLYVVSEIERTEQACVDLKKGDLISFGKKMSETHRGLSALYEVSCKEADFLVETASTHSQVIGARMMGGGFGGCTINLIHKTAEKEVVETVKQLYLEAFDYAIEVHQTPVTKGVSTITI